MAAILTLWIIFSSLVAVYSFDNLKDCAEAKNYTFPERKDEFTSHNYRFIEDCLYVHLSRKANKESGRRNTIEDEIPVETPGKILTIFMEETTLTDIADPDDSLRDVSVSGMVKFSWIDYRMIWSPTKWHKETLDISYASSLWHPDLTSSRMTGRGWPFGIGIWDNTKSTYKGTLRATWNFNSEDAKCLINFEKFPSDEHYCCFEVSPRINADVLKFAIKKRNGVIDNDLYSKVWKIEALETKLVVDKQKNYEGHGLKICFLAARSSKTLKLVFTLPLSVVAVLVVISPLFGPLKTQNYVKLFTLLVQVLCLQGLISHSPKSGFGDTTPKIFHFYEFSISITLFSLLISVVLAAIGRLERKIPPSHQLYLFATAINSKLCCGELQPTLSRASQYQQSSDGHQPVAEAGVNYSRDWMEIFMAVNNLFSGVILVAFVVGAIVLVN